VEWAYGSGSGAAGLREQARLRQQASRLKEREEGFPFSFLIFQRHFQIEF
jgi:hypothetical protein